jgi:transcriptional regulator with XRE-family HTH domain
MQDDVIGRCLRALRHRLGLKQSEVATRAGVARSVLSDFEAGRIGSHRLDALRAIVAVLGGSLRLDVALPGGDVRRLLDADHAALQERFVAWLRRVAWIAEVEVTFSRYGERGSIDIMAWHPATRILLVIEIKTIIVDVQALLSTLDRKTRNARVIAEERGWRPLAIVPMLVVREGTTARRHVATHSALFARFALRGRAAMMWLRTPTSAAPPSGLLAFAKLPAACSRDRRRAGRRRIRSTSAGTRSADAGNAA